MEQAGFDLEKMKSELADRGYLIFPRAVAKATLDALHQRIVDAFEEEKKSGSLFSGGGNFSGHLNCFPGEGSRAVYDELKASGLIAAMKTIYPRASGEPNVGLNFNMPKSV